MALHLLNKKGECRLIRKSNTFKKEKNNEDSEGSDECFNRDGHGVRPGCKQ